MISIVFLLADLPNGSIELLASIIHKFRNLPRFFCLNKLNFLYCLNETIFSLSYALSTRFTIKQKVSARKVWRNASDKFGFNPLSTSQKNRGKFLNLYWWNSRWKFNPKSKNKQTIPLPIWLLDCIRF
jgi:hypothetical protein